MPAGANRCYEIDLYLSTPDSARPWYAAAALRITPVEVKFVGQLTMTRARQIDHPSDASGQWRVAWAG